MCEILTLDSLMLRALCEMCISVGGAQLWKCTQ